MINSAFSLAFNGKALLNNSKEMLWNRNIFTVTTATDGHGSLTAFPMSGFSGTNVTLSNTPNANYGFSGYSITGATLTGNQFTLNNDVTAKANFSGYTAINFGNSPLVFQATNTNSGRGNIYNSTSPSMSALQDPVFELTATSITQTKSINVTYDLMSRTYNGRDVNLTYTANLFPYSGYTDEGSYSALSNIKNYLTNYSSAIDVSASRYYLTAGHLKLGNNESAVVTAVYIDLTGNVGNYAVTNLPNAGFKITLNNTGLPTIATRGDAVGRAHIHTDDKIVLQNPIVLTNTNPYLTFTVTGLMPAQVASFTNVQMWNSHWYGYIRGADL